LGVELPEKSAPLPPDADPLAEPSMPSAPGVDAAPLMLERRVTRTTPAYTEKVTPPEADETATTQRIATGVARPHPREAKPTPAFPALSMMPPSETPPLPALAPRADLLVDDTFPDQDVRLTRPDTTSARGEPEVTTRVRDALAGSDAGVAEE